MLLVQHSTAIKKFDIPEYYRSSIIGSLKEFRRKMDLRKQDFSPTTLDFGPVTFYVARHFGFCYGVENAIEISYRALNENPDRRVFLLSQMIHNQEVNRDLEGRGIKFILDTDGSQIVPWSDLKTDDVVIVPAFGITVEIEEMLAELGIEIEKYNTTCPFVEKVWNRSQQLAERGFTTIIHGKPRHEETRATFSRSARAGHSLVIRDMEEARIIARYIENELSDEEFFRHFKGRYTSGFSPMRDLSRVGVVNQTTMLATETQAISDFFRQAMTRRYGAEEVTSHFADTRDTLCYATNDNQESTYELLNTDADLAIVVGGYNSSNTSHIVELCEQKFPTYFINSPDEIISETRIRHFEYHAKKLKQTDHYMPSAERVKIVITSGASCPDTVVDRVILKLLQYYPSASDVHDVLQKTMALRDIS